MKVTFFLAIVALLVQPTFAESRIEGHVEDESGGALAACRVVLLNSRRVPLLETQTNAVGNYVLRPLVEGRYYIQVTPPGFESSISEVNLPKEPVVHVAFVLRIAKVEVQVSVGAASTELSVQPDENATALTLTSDDLDLLPSSLNGKTLQRRESPDCNFDDPRVVIQGYFRTNHTSATWQPRPAPTLPGAWRQVRISSPSAVASRGMSNSIG